MSNKEFLQTVEALDAMARAMGEREQRAGSAVVSYGGVPREFRRASLAALVGALAVVALTFRD